MASTIQVEADANHSALGLACSRIRPSGLFPAESLPLRVCYPFKNCFIVPQEVVAAGRLQGEWRLQFARGGRVALSLEWRPYL